MSVFLKDPRDMIPKEVLETMFLMDEESPWKLYLDEH